MQLQEDMTLIPPSPLSEASAQFLNLVFPNNTGDSARDFKQGDVFGTASTTVKIR